MRLLKELQSHAAALAGRTDGRLCLLRRTSSVVQDTFRQPEKRRLWRSVVSPEPFPVDRTTLSAFSPQNKEATWSLIRTTFCMFVDTWRRLGSCSVTLGLCETHTSKFRAAALRVVNLKLKVTFSPPAGGTCECRLLAFPSTSVCVEEGDLRSLHLCVCF